MGAVRDAKSIRGEYPENFAILYNPRQYSHILQVKLFGGVKAG